MTSDLAPGIIRILRPDGATSGTGFLASNDGLIITCSHVVQNHEQQKHGSPRPDKVTVAFNSVEEVRQATVVGEWWREAGKEDVAILRLEGPLPEGVQPLSLGSSSGTSGHRFKTFGFPDARSVEGMWGYGQIGDSVPQEGRHLLQLTGTTEVTPGFSGGPVLDTNTRRVVGMVTAILAPDRYGRLAETAFITPTEELRAICPLLKLSDIRPYLGLSSFTEADSEFFFGRQKVVERFLESLRRDPRFLAVFGPSGSGKSSVVMAKLVPMLRQGALPGSDEWEITVIRRSDRPFEQLSEKGLLLPGESLYESIKIWIDLHPDKSRLMLIFDQFEELLVTSKTDLFDEFSKQLASVNNSALPVTVILVIRDDFYSLFVKRMLSLLSWLERGLVNVPSVLERDELESIIKEPAKRVGLDFEPGLVDVIINDVLTADTRNAPQGASGPVGRSTMLPLLEFALTEVWERRRDGLLTHDAYNAIGGVIGGLATWAERAVSNLDVELQPLIHCVFTGLVHLGLGPVSADTRQRKPLDELCLKEHNREAVRKVVDSLTEERLLITYRDRDSNQIIVDIIHEALIREWGRLQQWLIADRRFLLWRQAIEERARSWIETDTKNPAGRDEGRLLRGRDLSESESWLKERGGDLSPDLLEFIRSGLDLQAREAAERERLRRRTIKVLIGGIIVAASLALIAGWFWQESVAQKEIAISHQLAAQSELLGSQQASMLPQSILLAVESLKRSYSAEADWILKRNLGLLHRRMLNQSLNHEDIVYDIAFSPDGRYLATASADKTARIWEAASGKEVGRLEHSGMVWRVAFSPDGKYIATGGEDVAARLWTVPDGVATAVLFHNGPVNDLAFSPDSKYLATASDDGTAILWETDRGKEIGRMMHDGNVSSVSFSPDGKYLATGSYDYSAVLWQVPHLKRVARMLHDDYVNDVTFSPNGDYLATASDDNTAQLWKVPTCERVAIMNHRDLVNNVAFSPDGLFLATASFDHSARMWDVPNGSEVSRMSHEDAIRRIAFSPDGERLATASFDNTGRLWWANSGTEIAIMPHNNSVNAIAFSPDNRSIATASHDKTAVIWASSDEREVGHIDHEGITSKVVFSPDGRCLATANDDGSSALWSIPENRLLARMKHDSCLNDVAFSQNGDYLATASDDMSARVWNLTGSKILEVGHEGPVWSAAFSPDDKYLVTASDDNTARLWDIRSGKELKRLIHDDVVWSAVFSPDGKRIATASEDRSSRVWDLNGNEVERIDHSGRVNGVMYSPDGRYLAAKCDDNTASLWDTSNYDRVLLVAHDAPVEQMAFSADSRYFATAGFDSVARIFDIQNRTELPAVKHGGIVWSLSFSPDGRYLATASSDNTAGIWDVRSGREVELFLHAKYVNAVSFSPDGKHIATGDFDYRVHIWEWQMKDSIAEACSRLNFNLNSREWKLYLGEEPYCKTCPNLP